MKPIVNRQARAEYEFLQEWDAGIVLHGAEVKSVKGGGMNLKGAYISTLGGELWLKNAHISPYQKKNQPDYNPDRDRKLLMKKSEIASIMGKMQSQGLTLVPKRVYSKQGLIKVQIALARGLKRHDKRDKIKKRDSDRDIARRMKHSI